jgi:hypothetical protein
MKGFPCGTENHQPESSDRTGVSRLWHWLDTQTIRATVLWGLVLAVGLEIFTYLLRFGAGLEATRDTCALAVWTFGLRIHHAYIGVLLLLLAALARKGGFLRLLLLLSVGLIVSDLAHHFAVLWPLTGDPQFHLRYADLAMVR